MYATKDKDTQSNTDGVKSAPPGATSAQLVVSVLVLEDAHALPFLLK